MEASGFSTPALDQTATDSGPTHPCTLLSPPSIPLNPNSQTPHPTQGHSPCSRPHALPMLCPLQTQWEMLKLTACLKPYLHPEAFPTSPQSGLLLPSLAPHTAKPCDEAPLQQLSQNTHCYPSLTAPAEFCPPITGATESWGGRGRGVLAQLMHPLPPSPALLQTYYPK